MPNYLAETDFVAEAGDILAGRTRKLASERHLEALAQLVRVARDLIHPGVAEDMQSERVRDWLREAAKISR